MQDILSGVRAGTLEPMVLVRCRCGWLRWVEAAAEALRCPKCKRIAAVEATLAEALTEQEAA